MNFSRYYSGAFDPNIIYNKLLKNNFFSKKFLIIGDKKRFIQLEDIYKSLFDIVGCVDIHFLEEIKNYQYDSIILMNLMNIIDLNRANGSIKLEKELIKNLIKNYNINSKNIYTDAVFSIAKNIDKRISLGNKYPEKTFLVVQLQGTAGLASFIMNVASCFYYAKIKKYTLIVDMMTYKNQYLEEFEVGKINAWEKFFEQPAGYSINDIQNSKNIILVSRYINFENTTLSFLKLKPELQKKILEYNNTLFKENIKILGVLFRGSDYSNRKPYNHPIQPDLKTMVSKVKEKLSEWGGNTGFDFIYLCTEVEEAILRFQEEFHEKLYYYPQKRVSANCCEYLSSITFDRENDTYLRGADYFIALNALSKCDSLIAGMCTGTRLALKLNKNNYNHTYIFNLGKYGIDDI